MKGFILITLLIFSSAANSLAQDDITTTQKVLVLDRYGTKRIKLIEGDRIWFSLKKDSKVRYKDYIAQLNDSTITLANRKTKIKLSEISALYFTNGIMTWLNAGSYFVGGGFLISAAVHPLVGDAQYDQTEAAIIGASFIAISQITRFLKRKKYKINSNTRIRILDLSFQPKEEESTD